MFWKFLNIAGSMPRLVTVTHLVQLSVTKPEHGPTMNSKKNIMSCKQLFYEINNMAL